MRPDEIGIVIIGRDEGQRLIDCLTSLKNSPLRIVYVDSGSEDGSPEVAERFGAVVIRLDPNRPFTAARGRNEGFAALLKLEPNIKFVQFLDGDCELVTGWLDAAWSVFAAHEDIAVVCGRRRERYPERSVYNRLCDIEWDTPTGEGLACGGDALIRVEAFKEAGGFNPAFVAGEEPELCARMRRNGWKIWRLDADMTRHDAAMVTFGQWWRRAVRSGYGEAEIAFHSSNRSLADKKQVARAIIWAGIVPTVIIIITFLCPAALATFLVYPLQVGRIAFRRGALNSESWAYGLFMTIIKFPQLQGNLKFLLRYFRGNLSKQESK